MTKYSAKVKEQMVRRMMPSASQRVTTISRESGICAPTLYAWQKQFLPHKAATTSAVI